MAIQIGGVLNFRSIGFRYRHSEIGSELHTFTNYELSTKYYYWFIFRTIPTVLGIEVIESPK
ncbi:MAG: hypothetical protein II449_10825 [Prevotella sp.]|nr:hypothetical protein [Prevotella sp.]